ncbi:AAA family ATPase [Corynebacterium camporealensis]
MIIIDEAERLPPTALEMLRDIHDRDGVAIMFIGMPGIDQRFRHYPQLFNRLGFRIVTVPWAKTSYCSC